MLNINDIKIAVIGLGYVGLPLAVEFGRKLDVVGFDINQRRLDELKSGLDSTRETTSREIKRAKKLTLSSKITDIQECNFFVVTVPTPVDEDKIPDLSLIKSASKTVGSVLKKNDIVVYESTVFPGATEDICVPILEKESNLVFNQDFFCGYSPERINPGDKEHTLKKITKITSGSTSESADLIDKVYLSIIDAGTHKAESIKVAEAAKVIENTQRDLNIALMNELSIIFNKMNIDTQSVLNAAQTKWNFLPFKPGLVGGHCIGVDPYYLTHKSMELGYKPEIILSGRNLNDRMSNYVAKMMNEMVSQNKKNTDRKPRVLVMGLTFKENCPDIRNSKIFDLVSCLESAKHKVDVYDPWVTDSNTLEKLDVNMINSVKENFYDGIILAVGHSFFIDLGVSKIKTWGKKNSIFFDLKSIFHADESDFRL